MAELVDAPDSKSGHFLLKTLIFLSKFNNLNSLRHSQDTFKKIKINRCGEIILNLIILLKFEFKNESI